MNLLLIEDNPEDVQTIKEALANRKSGSHSFQVANRLSKGLERLAGASFDLLLLDLSLPDSQGLHTLTEVHAKAKETPVVVLTSTDDDGLALEALQQGAQDYLVKGYVQVYPELLLRTMRYAVERKRAEQKEKQLVEAAAELERQRVAELERAYQELKRTQAMLVQAGKMTAIGQLASGIAHEVKNPLNIILQSITYLEPELAARGGQAIEILQVIREAVLTADKIIRGLLDFSKPAPLQLKRASIAPVLEASLMLVQNQLAARQIRLVKEVASALPPVMLDQNQMKQVFINLILNALHAMPNGGELFLRAAARVLTKPDIAIGARITDIFKLGETVLVCDIEDTGSGIPRDILHKVFNPFFTTKPPGEGVGLGLPITAAIVEGHRGLIHLESEEGRGTKAILMLPLAPEGGGEGAERS
jgi:signal transduction histidine kinase